MTRFFAIVALTCLMPAAEAPAQTPSPAPQTAPWNQLRPPDATLITRRQLGVLTYTKLTLRFDRTPARQAFETLRERLAIPMVGRYRDDPTGHGIDPDSPITLDFTDVSALSVLEEMLSQCAEPLAPCTWQLRTGFVEFGTKKRLSVPAARETRLHYIADLILGERLIVRQRREELAIELVELIVETIEPGSWDWGQPLDEPDDIPTPEGSAPPVTDLKVRRATPETPTEAPAEQPADPAEHSEPASEPDVVSRRYVAPRRTATIRYWRDFFIVHAPDYIHRQIGGYPEPIPPEGSMPQSR